MTKFWYSKAWFSRLAKIGINWYFFAWYIKKDYFFYRKSYPFNLLADILSYQSYFLHCNLEIQFYNKFIPFKLYCDCPSFKDNFFRYRHQYRCSNGCLWLRGLYLHGSPWYPAKEQYNGSIRKDNHHSRRDTWFQVPDAQAAYQAYWCNTHHPFT